MTVSSTSSSCNTGAHQKLRSARRRVAAATTAMSAAALLAAAGVLFLAAQPQPAAAMFWPRHGFASNAFGDAFDHHFRAIDQLNALTNAVFAQPKARAHTTRITINSPSQAAAPAAAAADNHWQPMRSADSVWDRLIAAQAKQWQCEQHCRARTYATLPYEAEISERIESAQHDGCKKCHGDVEVALRLPNVKPSDVHVQVTGGDSLSIRATRSPRVRVPNALDTECGCAQQMDADATQDGAAAAAEESIERTYSLGRFVDADRITATVSQSPATADGEFVTTVTVRVPKAVRPDTKRIALTAVAAPVAQAVAAPPAAPAIAAPEPATKPAPAAAHTSAADKPGDAAATQAAPAAPAAAVPEEPLFGTTAVAANSAAPTPVSASDATDEVINI